MLGVGTRCLDYLIYIGNMSNGNQFLRENLENLNLSHTMWIKGALRRGGIREHPL